MVTWTQMPCESRCGSLASLQFGVPHLQEPATSDGVSGVTALSDGGRAPARAEMAPRSKAWRSPPCQDGATRDFLPGAVGKIRLTRNDRPASSTSSPLCAPMSLGAKSAARRHPHRPRLESPQGAGSHFDGAAVTSAQIGSKSAARTRASYPRHPISTTPATCRERHGVRDTDASLRRSPFRLHLILRRTSETQ